MSKYEKQFKKEAVRLALTSNQAIAKTARDLGIKENTLYAWVSVAKDEALDVSDRSGGQANLVEELNRLRKRIPA